MTLRNDLMQMSKMYGIPAEQMQAIMQNIAIDKEKEATRDKLANTMILNAIIKTENFEISDEEIDKAWEEHCKQANIKADDEAQKANAVDTIKHSLKTDKVREFLKQENKISYKELTEEELKAKREAEAKAAEEADSESEEKEEAKA